MKKYDKVLNFHQVDIWIVPSSSHFSSGMVYFLLHYLHSQIHIRLYCNFQFAVDSLQAYTHINELLRNSLCLLSVIHYGNYFIF